MNEALLEQYLAADSEEQRTWIVTNALLDSQPPELREAALAAAVPHWFNAAILAALLETQPLPFPGGEEAGQSGESSEIPLLGGARGGFLDQKAAHHIS